MVVEEGFTDMVVEEGFTDIHGGGGRVAETGKFSCLCCLGDVIMLLRSFVPGHLRERGGT